MTAASCTRVAVGFGAALLIAACGGGHGAARSYPVPTSGWHSGDPALTALSIGTLEGGYRHGRFCVWLIGPRRKRPGPIIWPAGYSARRRPLELLNAQGAVVARGGDEIKVGGGSAPVRRRDPCMLGQTSAFWVMSGCRCGARAERRGVIRPPWSRSRSRRSGLRDQRAGRPSMLLVLCSAW